MSSMDDVIKYAKQEQQHPMDPEIALQVLTADNGKLVRQLDTAAHGGTPDQNISKNDILAYLSHAGKPTDQTSALQDEALEYLLGSWDLIGNAVSKKLDQTALTNVLMENSGQVFDALDTAANGGQPDGKFGKSDVDAFLKHVKDDPSYAQRFDPEQIKAVTELQKNWLASPVCDLKEGMKPIGIALGDDLSAKGLTSYKKGDIEFDRSSGLISRDSLAGGLGFKSTADLEKFVSDNKYLDMTPAFDQNGAPTDSSSPSSSSSTSPSDSGGYTTQQGIQRDSQGRVTEVDSNGATEKIAYVGNSNDVQQIDMDDPNAPIAGQHRSLIRVKDGEYELTGGVKSTVQERIQVDQNGDWVVTKPDGSTQTIPVFGSNSKI